MGLYLKVIKGPLVGQHFPIKAEAVIGRSAGDIVISDQKISSKHAKIEVSLSGDFSLIDLGSSNGLWLEDQNVKKIALLAGVRFTIGNTLLEVVSEQPIESKKASLAVRQPSKKAEAWASSLNESISSLIAENSADVPNILPLVPAVLLEFSGGIQAGQSYLIGYGPRRFGADSLDFELLDPEAPPLAFEIIAENKEPLFISHDKNNITLNGKLISSEILKSGDTISIGKTKIKVSFYEGSS